jgi:hypothetical protein
MSPARADEGGIPRGRRPATGPNVSSTREDLSGANSAKADKLRLQTLKRRAHAHGFEVRHSAYGYALIDAARERVDDRSDLTLDDVESLLARAGET